MAKSYQYVVEGRWPFPLDMLRKDDSEALTAPDESAIKYLSQDHLPEPGPDGDASINLKGPSMPVVERWNSFGWRVTKIYEMSGKMRRSAPLWPPLDAQVTPKRRRVPGGIDLTPTWKGAMPVIIAALEDGTEAGKVHARAELMRAAAILDNMNAGLPGKDG